MFVSTDAFRDGDLNMTVPFPPTGNMTFTCPIEGKLTPKLTDYTCTRDCEDPLLDASIMTNTFQQSHSTVIGYNLK